MDNNYTKEEVKQHIANAYHSIAIIDELEALDSLDEEQQDRLDRNKEHVRIMLGKEWFDNGLTKTKRNELTTKSAQSDE